MDAAITGATGHVGASLVRSLIGQGRSVRVLVRDDLRAVDGLNVKKVRGDVLDFESLLRLFKGVKTVFHLAAKISIVGSESGTVEKINVEGTNNVIKACLKCGVKRLVHFSSIHAFRAKHAGEVLDETGKLATGESEFPYDRSKAVAQLAVLDSVRFGLEAIVLNPTGIIGPYDFKPSRMGGVLMDIYHRRYPALIDGGYDWVDSRDVAACALAAEKKGKPGDSYLVSGNWLHLQGVARIIEKLYGIKAPHLVVPAWLCTIPSYCSLAVARTFGVTPKLTPYSLKVIRTRHSVSHDKASRVLGYNPRPVEETIRDTMTWFNERGMLAPAR
jgi:dihydroflavonol-4-reductase